ncbi:MAG: nucleotidyl transferase AbiEii/AbiGii toxin family protein [Patescibacteria group bacterium]
MISQELIKKIASQNKTADFPNIVREYFQHLFLSELYRLSGAENLLFKGGTALRIIYGSPRFSEDLDFTLIGVEGYRKKEFAESLFLSVLTEIEKIGIKVEINRKSDETREGYFGDANYQVYDYPETSVSINISSREGKDIKGEIDSIANDFIPTYNILHLSKNVLVEEKITAAITRAKPRDFYDVYFILRKNLLATENKKILPDILDKLNNTDINFTQELGIFLPKDQQQIVKDFKNILTSEIKRYI